MDPFLILVVFAFASFAVVLSSVAWWSNQAPRARHARPVRRAAPARFGSQASSSMSQ
jgi:hypothetical protein